MIGILALVFAAIFTLVAIVLNMLNLIDENKKKTVKTRAAAKTPSRNAAGKASSQDTAALSAGKRTGLFYDLSVVSIIAASVTLLVLFLTNQFNYIYVAQYSSAELSTVFKITAFWAGQEGSFLLWVLIFGLIGLMLNHRKSITPGVKLVYSVLQLCLLIILIVKNPFMQNSQIVEGLGLNPLLQNFWMISHPPFLFLGYAALAVPFALAVGSLLDGDYKSWVKKALPFSLFAWAFLGIGIFLGGYWAYEVLGWGGYWAWDPVENSSLIPWLAAGALVHFLILSLRKPTLVKPAYLTAVFSFGLALYGTFLTRSGVLSDFSTHSFADAGLTGLMALIIFPVVMVALILLIIKWTALPSEQEEEPVKTRGFMTFLGSLALSVFAVVVLMGTSMPFITGLLGNSSNVSMSYFNVSGLVLIVAILLFLALATLYPWNKAAAARKVKADEQKTKKTQHALNDGEHQTEKAEIEAAADLAADAEKTKNNKTVVKIGVAIAGAVLFVIAGLAINIKNTLFVEILVYLGLATAGAVFAISILSFSKGFGRGMSKAALFTHIGLAVLVAGVIFSSAGSKTESPVVFKVGEQKTVLGRELTYISIEDMADGQSYVQRFSVDGTTVDIPTRIDERYGFERKPAILWSLLGDYYIAPSVQNAGYTFTLATPSRINIGDDQLEVILMDFGMASQDPDNPSVYVLLNVALNDKHEEVRLELVRDDSGSDYYTTVPVDVFDKYKFHLDAVNRSQSQVSLYIYGIDETIDQVFDQIHVEVSTKPLIMLVWLGTIMISVGIIWAALKRWGPSPFQDLHNRKQKEEAIM